MNKFNLKNKAIIICSIIIFLILIVLYLNFNITNYEAIIDKDELVENIMQDDKNNNSELNEKTYEENNLIYVHIARSRKKRRSCRSKKQF